MRERGRPFLPMVATLHHTIWCAISTKAGAVSANVFILTFLLVAPHKFYCSFCCTKTTLFCAVIYFALTLAHAIALVAQWIEQRTPNA